jgi:hypothetical protein
MNSVRLRTLLIRGCDRDREVEYPNVQWGYGKLNFFKSLTLLREE